MLDNERLVAGGGLLSPFSATAGILLIGLHIPNSSIRDTGSIYSRTLAQRVSLPYFDTKSTISITTDIQKSTTSGASRSQASGWRMARSASSLGLRGEAAADQRRRDAEGCWAGGGKMRVGLCVGQMERGGEKGLQLRLALQSRREGRQLIEAGRPG